MSFKIPNRALIIQLVILLILVLALPFALNLLQKQTVFRSKASNDPIVFKEDNNVVVRNGQKVAIRPEVVVELTSTLGPPESSNSAAPLAMGQVLGVEVTPSPTPTPCSDFYLSNTGGSGSDIGSVRTNSWGGHEYDFNQDSFTVATLNFFLDTNPANGITPSLSITESADMVTPNSASQKLVNIPKNVGATKKSYKITAQLNFKDSSSSACDPITINVDPPSTTPTPTPIAACSYQGTEIMFRDPTEPNPEWRPQPLIVYKGRSLEVAALHTTASGISGTPASDVAFTIRSSNEQPYTFPAPSTGIISFTPSPGNITSNVSYTVDVATTDQAGTNCTNSKQFAVAPPSVRTRYYKIADSPTALATASAKPYTEEPTEETIKFSDTNPGRKFVFVQFIGIASDGTEKTETRNAYIDYVGPDPIINSLACTSQIGDGGVLVQIQGQYLGTGSDSSAVSVDNSKTEIVGDWTDKSVTAKTTGTVDNQNQQGLTVNLTRSDGQQVKSKCAIGVSQVSLVANNFCQIDPGSLGQKNADIILVDKSGNVSEEAITLGNDGVLKDLKTQFQENQKYRLSVKILNSLIRSTEFKAGKGTTVLNGLDIPFGDLNNDGKINSADYTMLLRAWRGSFASSQNDSSSAQISNLAADLNNDGVINSFDLSCLVHYFNLQSDSDVSKPPTPDLIITPTLPVASESATPVASESATPVASESAIIPL